MPKDCPLNRKQLRFCQEYLKDANATQAAIRAGYSQKTAKAIGSRLLTKVDVKEKVQDELEDLGIDARYILSSIKELGERCMQRKPVMVRDGKKWKQKTEIIEHEGQDVEVGVWEFDSTGANKAFENLGRFRKLFTDNVNGDVTVHPAVIEVPPATKGQHGGRARP